MAEARDFRYVGTRPIRPDGVDKVTGRANYGADFAMPGMLYGAVVRSPHAHANVVSIDTSGALALDGVRAVVTGADFPSVAPGEIEGGEGEGAATRSVCIKGGTTGSDDAHRPDL